MDSGVSFSCCVSETVYNPSGSTTHEAGVVVGVPGDVAGDSSAKLGAGSGEESMVGSGKRETYRSGGESAAYKSSDA